MLRGDGAETGFFELTARVTGLEPPRRPKALSQGEGGALLWLSPDEWLLISRRRQRLAAWLPALERGYAEQRLFAQALDVSGGFTAVYLCGEPHLAVLRHLGGYDFEALRPGQGVCTLLGKAAVQVLRLDGDGVFVVCRRSFATTSGCCCGERPGLTASRYASCRKTTPAIRCGGDWRGQRRRLS
ncbi:hypothetical protein JOS77_00740 [Chromobacterium haemolyticum]|nr:hypothetical protein JOS77_00740 [Chromobacterium haemolyticum]